MFTTRSVAAALAALPAAEQAPRVIQQFTSIFLVNRFNEIWRVYDCETSDGDGRRMPSTGTLAAGRLFVGLARKAEVRIHFFGICEARDTSPDTLQRQLDDSQLVS